MRAFDIKPGAMYALRPTANGPLRAVKAVQARQDCLIYEGAGGHRLLGDLSKVIGPWEVHDRARANAQRAVDQIAAVAPIPAEDVRLVERGFADFRVLITCTTEQALRLAESSRGGA